MSSNETPVTYLDITAHAKHPDTGRAAEHLGTVIPAEHLGTVILVEYLDGHNRVLSRERIRLDGERRTFSISQIG